MPVEERIGAYIGNAVVFPQADGGRLLQTLPPCAESVAEHLVIAFVGTDEDFKRAYLKDFAISLPRFRRAYEWLRQCNSQYSQVQWDADAARALQGEGVAGIPPILAACIHRVGPTGAQQVTR